MEKLKNRLENVEIFRDGIFIKTTRNKMVLKLKDAEDLAIKIFQRLQGIDKCR